eukprot:GHVN01059856.1.p1 GENE.GHVN01059856.1~~GHVN01059856.1.p1  ORF type:complete len:386 (+),score=24.02 GHVN01059856.1:126-1283(+)
MEQREVEFPFDQFPPLERVFLYGSSVAPSHEAIEGYDELSKGSFHAPMLDMIFVVDDRACSLDQWHSTNLKMNTNHYSRLFRYLGGPSCAFVHSNFPPPVWFNTLVSLNGVLTKYGVITRSDLIKDMRSWEWLFAAGRLHKPVIELRPPGRSSDGADDISEALVENHHSALRAALLGLNRDFSYAELMAGICRITYFGDPRSRQFEQPNKAVRISYLNLLLFAHIYLPLLFDGTHSVSLDVTMPLKIPEILELSRQCWNNKVFSFDFVANGGYCNGFLMGDKRLAKFELDLKALKMHQNVAKHQRHQEFSLLPSGLRKEIKSAHLTYKIDTPTLEIFSKRYLQNGIASLVSRNATRSMCKNALTAGLGKSIKYVLRKRAKAINDK